MRALIYMRHNAVFYSCVFMLLGLMALFAYNRINNVLVNVHNVYLSPEAEPGDLAITRKDAVIEKNDIVIFTTDSNELFINRVYAVHGDHVIRTKDNFVVNGTTVKTGNFINVYESQEFTLEEHIFMVGADLDPRYAPHREVEDQLRKVVEIIKFNKFTGVDWLRLVLGSLFLVILMVTPLISFIGGPKTNIYKKILIIPHTIATLYLMVFYGFVLISEFVFHEDTELLPILWKIPMMIFYFPSEILF